MLVENGSGRIIGAHLLAPEASGVINLFALAMRTGLSAGDLKKLVSSYPSAGSDVVYLLEPAPARNAAAVLTQIRAPGRRGGKAGRAPATEA